MSNQIYPTGLTDHQWEYIRKYVRLAKPGGTPRTLHMREVINAILYIVVGGVSGECRHAYTPSQ